VEGRIGIEAAAKNAPEFRERARPAVDRIDEPDGY
jgi:hypothetical protein